MMIRVFFQKMIVDTDVRFDFCINASNFSTCAIFFFLVTVPFLGLSFKKDKKNHDSPKQGKPASAKQQSDYFTNQHFIHWKLNLPSKRACVKCHLSFVVGLRKIFFFSPHSQRSFGLSFSLMPKDSTKKARLLKERKGTVHAFKLLHSRQGYTFRDRPAMQL